MNELIGWVFVVICLWALRAFVFWLGDTFIKPDNMSWGPEDVQCEGCKRVIRCHTDDWSNYYEHIQQCRMWHMNKVIEAKNKRRKK